MSPTEITFVGHSTLLLKMNGIKIITDPILGRHPRYFILMRRRLKPGFTLEQLLDEKIDAILLSHSHLDHYHIPTLRRFPRETPLFVPKGYESRVQSAYKHFTDIYELDLWQHELFNGIKITAVPANHPRNAIGYVLEGDHVLYFPGDTGCFKEISEFPNRFPPFDVIFLPIMERFLLWRRLNPHIDARDAVRIVKILKPTKHAIPIHFGFYPRRNYLKIPLEFKKLLEKEGLQHLFYLLLNGETLKLS
ncbi:MAG: MBL fold metallo-hydrolase [Candidatus Helarchaeota archaeon]